jgi:hypothetical protein
MGIYSWKQKNEKINFQFKDFKYVDWKAAFRHIEKQSKQIEKAVSVSLKDLRGWKYSLKNYRYSPGINITLWRNSKITDEEFATVRRVLRKVDFPFKEHNLQLIKILPAPRETFDSTLIFRVSIKDYNLFLKKK